MSGFQEGKKLHLNFKFGDTISSKVPQVKSKKRPLDEDIVFASSSRIKTNHQKADRNDLASRILFLQEHEEIVFPIEADSASLPSTHIIRKYEDLAYQMISASVNESAECVDALNFQPLDISEPFSKHLDSISTFLMNWTNLWPGFTFLKFINYFLVISQAALKLRHECGMYICNHKKITVLV